MEGSTSSVTFANAWGEVLAPVLLWLRGLGFFEAHVYMPLMTLAAVAAFWVLARRLHGNGTFDGRGAGTRRLWLAAYFGLCFLGTNSLAVGLKTLIVEEMDYETRVWFEAYVGPLHFYIAAVVVAYVVLLLRNRPSIVDRSLGLFVQVGLLAGYGVAVFRIINEPITLDDPTTGISGFILGSYFALYNYDLYSRFIGVQTSQLGEVT